MKLPLLTPSETVTAKTYNSKLRRLQRGRPTAGRLFLRDGGYGRSHSKRSRHAPGRCNTASSAGFDIQGGANMQRRGFFGAVFSGLASAAGARAAKPKAGDLQARVLGKTGQNLTVIGMGGARFHLLPFDEGVSLVRRAYDLGINYFDMARSYWDGRAEEVYGAAIPPFRKNIFLTTKSGERTRQGAERELETSLKLMKTDYVDLWQLHGVNQKQDMDKFSRPGGALEAFVAAKKAGKCRYIGFTGHADPALNLEMLRNYDGFDTMLMPLHAADTAYLSFEKGALPAAVERGIGILGMKIFGNAFLLRAFSVRDCLTYTLSLPVHAVTLGFPPWASSKTTCASPRTSSPCHPNRWRRSGREREAIASTSFGDRRSNTGSGRNNMQNRRDLLQTGLAAAVAAPLPGPARPWGFRSAPFPSSMRAPRRCSTSFRRRAAVNTLFLATFTYGRGIAGPAGPGPAAAGSRQAGVRPQLPRRQLRHARTRSTTGTRRSSRGHRAPDHGNLDIIAEVLAERPGSAA